MRTRLVDVLLMAGLFLVGAAILWTLFTLGNDRGRPVTADGAPVASADDADVDPEDGGDVLAVPPADAAADVEGDAAAEPEQAADPDQDAPPAADGEDPPAEPDVGAGPSNDGVPVIEGEPVDLQRVGFSFVTGGAGACGVTLEPWEHVAVSRDLLAVYGCGAEITIQLADEVAGRSEATLTVGDTMNEQFTRTANIYVGEDEPALEYGVTAGTLIP